MPIRLAIVDGQTLIRYGLRELVAHHSDIEIVAECQSAGETLPMLAATHPDVVTVDVALPDGDGLRLARELRDIYASLGIVMLTSKHEDDILFRALETGVSAFVPKTAPLDEVLAAIRHAAVAAGSRSRTQPVADGAPPRGPAVSRGAGRQPSQTRDTCLRATRLG